MIPILHQKHVRLIHHHHFQGGEEVVVPLPVTFSTYDGPQTQGRGQNYVAGVELGVETKGGLLDRNAQSEAVIAIPSKHFLERVYCGTNKYS